MSAPNESATMRPYMQASARIGAATSTAATVEISVVVPVYNEAAGLEAFFARLMPVLDRLRMTYEIVCVDDGSSDASLVGLLGFRQRIPALKVLSLSRNFGKDIALSAGLDYTSGAALVTLDRDLQDPPEMIE